MNKPEIDELSPKELEIRKEAFFLMAMFASDGISAVNVEFSGSGDDGAIDEVLFQDTENNFIADKYDGQVEDWAYKMLDETGVDWYNNEGGHGNIHFDVKNRSYAFEVYQHTRESELVAKDLIRFGEWTPGEDN